MLDKSTIEGQLVSRRTFIIGAGKLGLLFLLAGRMFYMQFIKKNEYKTLSDQNRIKMIVIAPSRGQIYDKARRVIAKNNTCFKLLLDKLVPFKKLEIFLLPTINVFFTFLFLNLLFA